MAVCVSFVCFFLGLLSLAAGSTHTDLPGPCRTWLFPCGNGVWRCSSEDDYWQFQSGPQPLCPSIYPTVPPPLPASHCEIVDGVCQFTNTTVNCTTWSHSCEPQYECGTEEERERSLAEMPESCFSPHNFPPHPGRICVPSNDSCEWYNPCKMWQGSCPIPYQCGTLDDYYTFFSEPQPVCSPLPPGWVTPTPPGQCIVQNGQCSWSNCTAWLGWCQTSWQCGTQYDKDVYRAGPIPPCAYPGDNYVPPPPPGQCTFQTDTQMCEFVSSNQCSGGKEYTTCGSACPLTCDNFGNPPGCIALCVPGCFCPPGMVDYNGNCVDPSVCPNPCAVVDCAQHFTCEVGSTGEASCIPTCEYNNGGCSVDKECIINSNDCTDTTSPYCISSSYMVCKDPANVPCSKVNVNNVCTSNNARCLVQNKTRETKCVDSCYLGNGGCGSDRICFNKVNDDCKSGNSLADCETHVECLGLNDMAGNQCPPGLEYNNCGSYCETNCDSYITGEYQYQVCPAVCVNGCFCPYGTIKHRDRCVDPRECFVLVNDPPPLNVLPVTKPNVVLVSLTAPNSSPDSFRSIRDVFINIAGRLLQNLTTYWADVKLHGYYEDEEGLKIVLRVSGVGDRVVSASGIIEQLRANSNLLPLQVTSIQTVETQVIPPAQALSGGAIAGIVVVAVLLLLAIVIAAVVLVAIKGWKSRQKIRAVDNTRVDPTAVSYARLEKDKGADSEQDITVTFAPEEEKADISAEES